MAGMAFANAFLGICHSMAHKLGAMFHLPHGLANALLINEVIRYNASDAPRKQAAFSQYEYPSAKARYARIARYLELPGSTDDELVESLARCYRRQLEIAAGSPAEVVWLGDNITGTIVSPRVFQKYCKPIYDFDCAVLRQAGKISFAHFDGVNRPLRECIAGVALDVIEAFTPPPMEDMTVAEARRAWPDKVLSLNVPSNLFHLPAAEIERHVRQYVEEGGDKGRFIVGCTEDFDVRLFDHAFSAIVRAMYGVD